MKGTEPMKLMTVPWYAAYCSGASDSGELGTCSPSERESKPLSVGGGLTFTSLIAGP